MKTLIISSTSSKNIEANLIINEVYSFLELLEDEYPNFKQWYFKKVIPEIGFSRQFLLKYIKQQLVGVAILKRNPLESKICTFRVKEEYQGLGIGSNMLIDSFHLLNNCKPNITVSEKRLAEFSSILNKNGFKLDAIYPNYYNEGQKEYSFNGLIENKSHNCKDFLPSMNKLHREIL